MSSDIRAKTFLNSLSASTAAVAALQTTSGTAAMTLTAAAGTGAFHATDQAAKVTLTSGGNISGVTITLTGTDIAGNTLTEDIAGPNANTVTSTKFYDTITSVAGDGSIGTNTSIGVAAGTTGGQAKINSDRTRLKGIHVTTGGTVGDMTFYNTSPISGTSLFSIKSATTTKDYIDPYIPDDGIVFSGGGYIDLPAGTAVSFTVFYDG
tara:strand:+ start:625 stop:1248 length:624 start_codon:yes stop_codon:yes gene_type:complete